MRLQSATAADAQAAVEFGLLLFHQDVGGVSVGLRDIRSTGLAMPHRCLDGLTGNVDRRIGLLCPNGGSNRNGRRKQYGKRGYAERESNLHDGYLEALRQGLEFR